jgi:phosphatidylglycerol:prolipoprotein diacylglycerol transferase
VVVISVSPVIVSVGPLAVRWFGLLAVAGLGLGIWLVLRETRKQGIPRSPVLDALAWALPAGVIFARVIHVLGWWDYYFTHTAEIVQLDLEDGLSLWGGLVAGGIMAAARLGRDPVRRRRILDAAAPAVALGIGVGRIGEFLDGSGQGLPSDLPWATRYSSPLAATPDFGVGRHPAQLYDALVCLGLFVLLRGAAGARWPTGWRTAAFLILYAAARIGLGQVRLDPAFLFGLPIEEILAGGCLVYGVWYLAGLLRRRRGLARARGELERNDASLAA